MTIDPRTLEAVREFENVLLAARARTYAAVLGTPMQDVIFREATLAKLDLERFVEVYLRAAVFPVDRLPKLVSHLMDVKLELYYLVEVDLPLYNQLLCNKGFDLLRPREKPELRLIWMSLDQGLILKSRVLWDRIMNFLFYLEAGTWKT